MGEYYTAFFGLSVGLERLAKLILVTDHALSNNGQMPHQKVVSRFGHKLLDLMNAAEGVVPKRELTLAFQRPTNTVSVKIIGCLDSFADASWGRYANFAALGDTDLGAVFEPIRKWWTEVGEPILQEHYYGKRAQVDVEAQAQQMHQCLSDSTYVFHVDESGHSIQDVFSASVRTGQTELVQQYGRYYTFTVVRWLAEVFLKLSRSACYVHDVDAFFGVWEYLESFTVGDNFLKTRKIWPLR